MTGHADSGDRVAARLGAVLVGLGYVTEEQAKRKAFEEGMLTLRMSGLEKIRQGITSLEGVLRETVR
jgi:hypothetical protein